MVESDSEKTKRTNHRLVENIVTIRILLVDDHWEVRERLRILLMKEPDFQLVGEAADSAEALEVFKKSSTDLVIMDLNIPEISGIETAKQILAYRPDTKDHHCHDAVRPALREGNLQDRGDGLSSQGLRLRGAGGGRPHGGRRRHLRQPRDRGRDTIIGLRNFNSMSTS